LASKEGGLPLPGPASGIRAPPPHPRPEKAANPLTRGGEGAQLLGRGKLNTLELNISGDPLRLNSGRFSELAESGPYNERSVGTLHREVSIFSRGKFIF
jgi:hypothetical protein